MRVSRCRSLPDVPSGSNCSSKRTSKLKAVYPDRLSSAKLMGVFIDWHFLGAPTGCNRVSWRRTPMLRPTVPSHSAGLVAAIGLCSLASAMGIGRFSLTPLLPVMQAQLGLTLQQGSWLATANYIGYLAGALWCMFLSPRPQLLMRHGLLWVTATTLAMGVVSDFELWLALRFLAGAASAFVLVGMSAWVLPRLSTTGTQTWSGVVFSGVGLGISIAGLIVLAGIGLGLSASDIWLWLGALSVAAMTAIWPVGNKGDSASAPQQTMAAGSIPSDAVVAAACYSAFGFAYIIPATYLPALARAYVPSPLVFGWIWPLFGVAAACSTVFAASLTSRMPPRRIWINFQWLLAIGVLAPVVQVSIFTLLISAACAGGSFMVITMAGIREAYRLGKGRETSTIAMMTGSFGVGQIAGPLVVGLFGGSGGSLTYPSVSAAAALFASNLVLYFRKENPASTEELA